MERMQKGTIVQKRTMLQVFEQCVFLGEPSADRMNAFVAPIVSVWEEESGSDRGCLVVCRSGPGAEALLWTYC